MCIRDRINPQGLPQSSRRNGSKNVFHSQALPVLRSRRFALRKPITSRASLTLVMPADACEWAHDVTLLRIRAALIVPPKADRREVSEIAAVAGR